MLPDFLVRESTVRETGSGPVLEVAGPDGGTLLLTLGITRIIEQESLEVTVWGSADGSDYGSQPLASFPQKFYCGTYQTRIELSEHPDVRFLRAQWNVHRWGKSDSKPMFGVYLFAQQWQPQAAAALA